MSHFSLLRSNPRAELESHDRESKAADARYLELATSLNDHMQYIQFEELIEKLGLSVAFEQYSASIGDNLDILAESTSIISKGKIIHRDEEPVELQELEILRSFGKLFLTMRDRNSVLDKDLQYNRQHELTVRENEVTDDEKYIPYAGLYYIRIISKYWRKAHILIEASLESTTIPYPIHLGRIFSNVCTIWKEQPTRTFVPVLFLNGHEITLLLFARGGCYYTELGSFIRNLSQCGYAAVLEDIQQTLKQLWFLLIRPPECFGHIADITVAWALEGTYY